MATLFDGAKTEVALADLAGTTRVLAHRSGQASAEYGLLSTLLAFFGSFKDVSATVTAATTQSQGQGALTKAFNIVTTVANVDDTCTAIASAAVGQPMIVINLGANQMQLFPAANDILNTTGELIADQPVFIGVGDFYCGIRVTSTQWIHFTGTVSI